MSGRSSSRSPSATLGRRALLGATLASWFGCRSSAAEERAQPGNAESPPPLPPPARSADGRELPRRYEKRLLELPGSISPQVWALLPSDASAAQPLPVLVLLHGRGEALKGPKRGALGWPDDYALLRALERITNPPLTSADYFGHVEPSQLEAVNSQLQSSPFSGLAVLCPYLPAYNLDKSESLDGYGKFLCETLLPHARAQLPLRSGREHTAIDGISLGGATALHVGTQRPDVFGAVSGMQPALRGSDAERWASRFEQALAATGSMAVRLQSSVRDPFLGATKKLSAALHKRRVEHVMLETPGPHDYVYNRGPAAFATLAFHDRALRAPLPNAR